MEFRTNTLETHQHYGTIFQKDLRCTVDSYSTVLSDTLTVKSQLSARDVKKRKRLCLKAPNGKLFYGNISSIGAIVLGIEHGRRDSWMERRAPERHPQEIVQNAEIMYVLEDLEFPPNALGDVSLPLILISSSRQQPT